VKKKECFQFFSSMCNPCSRASSDSGDFLGILGDIKGQFLQVIKSLILMVKQS
jgi:hypothetical protein